MRLLLPLACDIGLPVLGLECIDETFVEAAELSGQLDLVSDVWSALAITDADRLFDPKHVGQIGPGVRVLDRSQCTGLPGERAVLGQETRETGTSRAAVQPDCNLLWSLLCS